MRRGGENRSKKLRKSQTHGEILRTLLPTPPGEDFEKTHLMLTVLCYWFESDTYTKVKGYLRSNL